MSDSNYGYADGHDGPGLSVRRRPAADRFDAVSIGVENERAVIVRVVLGSHTRGAVITPSRSQSHGVERIDNVSFLCHK